MPRPRTIAFVFPVGEWGGAESVFFELLSRLDRERFAPRAVFLRDGPFAQELERVGIPVHRQPITRLRDPLDFGQTVRALWRLLTQQGVQLVVSSHGYGHLYGGLAAWRVRLPAIWWQHGIASARHLIDRLASGLPARCVVVSSACAAEAQHRVLGTPRASLRVISPGVDVQRFRSPDPQRLARLREEFRLDRFRHLVSAIGRLERGKGQDLLLRAAQLVRVRRPDVGFLIVGREMPGDRSGYAASLRELARTLGLEGHVLWAGFRREIPEVLALSDLLVHAATEPESFGLVLCEAMAAERPVVATDLGGAREIVVSGETGWLVPPGDPVALAEAVLALLGDASGRQEMGRAARQRVLAHFDVRQMVARFERVLEESLHEEEKVP